MTKLGIAINLERCVGCNTCANACKMQNNIPMNMLYIRVETDGVDTADGAQGTYPDLSRTYIPVACQHCDNPECVSVCPTGASYRDGNNVVLIDREKCIGCKYCMMACPYGVRSWNAAESVVEKCTLCAHLSKNGELPMCVRTCSAGARFYGDIDDPSSDASKALAAADPASIHTLQDVGNHPATHYILSPKRAAWKEGE